MAGAVAPPHEYTAPERTLAKTLVGYLGGVEQTRQYLAEIGWTRVPEKSTVRAWVQNPAIPVDEGIVQNLQLGIRQTVLGHVREILDPLKERVLRSIAKDDAIEVSRLTSAYKDMAATVMPKDSGGTTYNIGGNLNAPQVILPFALRDGETARALPEPENTVDAPQIRDLDPETIPEPEPRPEPIDALADLPIDILDE